MSGPKKGDVQLKLNRALEISEKYSLSKWDNAHCLNLSDSNAADSAGSNAAGKSSGADAEVRNAFDEGERIHREAERLQNEAAAVHNNAGRRTDALKGNVERLGKEIANKNHYLRAEDEQAKGYVREAENIEAEERRAADLLRQSSEKFRQAKTVFEQSIIIADQKEEARRQYEMKRTATTNALQSVKNDVSSFGENLLGEWGSNTDLAEATRILQQAESKLNSEQFDESQSLSARASVLFRNLYEKSENNKKRFDSREIIVDAIAAALNDLQYDEPDVNYEPADGLENTMLGNITIFAKSKGKTGDMRLAVDLDGKVDLEVDDIPEGQESECHKAITKLQERVADVANLKITDWGRAKNVKNEPQGGKPRQQVKVQEQIKQRGV
ncbi:hypothetical protein FACS1894189_7120 [Planctomycetales bacterium]|nr:hypothetical protein FACS1894189_7120 [Planctomycetales bacterium]